MNSRCVYIACFDLVNFKPGAAANYTFESKLSQERRKKKGTIGALENMHWISSIKEAAILFSSIQMQKTKPRLEGQIAWPLLCNKNQHYNHDCDNRESDRYLFHLIFTLMLFPERLSHSKLTRSLKPSMDWMLLLGRLSTRRVLILAMPLIRTRRLLAIETWAGNGLGKRKK